MIFKTGKSQEKRKMCHITVGVVTTERENTQRDRNVIQYEVTKGLSLERAEGNKEELWYAGKLEGHKT